jgi:hypothetical protein
MTKRMTRRTLIRRRMAVGVWPVVDPVTIASFLNRMVAP